jgi:hypothetical protein
MKTIILQIVILAFLIPSICEAQTKFKLSPIDQNVIFKNIQGKYARVEVTMGLLTGTGGVNLGGLLPANNFSFQIYVRGQEDKQFGIMTSTEIETKNFEDYFIRINWANKIKTQGTIDGEIQIFYASRKEKIEAYFIGNSSFKIFWWLELTNENKKEIDKLLDRAIATNPEYIKMKNQNKKLSELKQLEDTLSKLRGEKNKIIREINDYNLKIKNLKSN